MKSLPAQSTDPARKNCSSLEVIRKGNIFARYAGKKILYSHFPEEPEHIKHPGGRLRFFCLTSF
jgi:hypothetical protein